MSHSLISRETPEARNAQRGPEATGLCVEEAGPSAHKRGGGLCSGLGGGQWPKDK